MKSEPTKAQEEPWSSSMKGNVFISNMVCRYDMLLLKSMDKVKVGAGYVLGLKNGS